ncbi:MAG: helix-turn-helix transcriptional regulator [Lachnospirales bacterium]
MYRNVMAEMKRKGLKQSDLAKVLSLAPSTVNQKLNGKSEFNLKEAAKIKEILGVDTTLEELFA